MQNIKPVQFCTGFMFFFSFLAIVTAKLKYLHVDWLQSLKQLVMNVSYHILVASLTLMALSYNRAIRVRLATSK